jgi:drug/metabolite transporter (DMT)-like permease
MNLFKAIGFKLISALLFAALSALVRQLGDVTPVGQLVFFRSACAIPPVLLIYAFRGEFMEAVRTTRVFGQLGRGALSVGGMYTNFSALQRLPLADATAISFASPLITVALAAIILKERIRIYRWTAVLVGFFGVIVMLIPHLDFRQYAMAGALSVATIGSLLALFAAFCNAGTVIQTRRLTQSETTSSIVFYFSLMTALAGLVSLPFAWHTPTGAELVMLIGTGVFGGVGHIFLLRAGFGGGAVRLLVDAVGAAARLLAVRRTADRAGLYRRGHRVGGRPLRDLARTATRRETRA